jgi:asparagine synthase (glutamine-hydrolysing)
MCGIAGIVDFSEGAERHASKLARMQALLRHRGPDAQGMFWDRHAALTHTRLAVIDAAASAQPLRSADGRWVIVYNGEVYNFRELRRQLDADWRFTTDGDAEVVLAAWVARGPACLPLFNGMFAFFVWDTREERGWLVRDRFGVKPAAWRTRNGVFEFASEAKAIVGSSDDAVRANRAAIVEYLAAPFFSGVQSTMFDGVELVQPGELLEVSRSGVRHARWYEHPLDVEEGFAPDLGPLVMDAVRASLVADVPICTFLSGGFDSTLITALAQRELGRPLDAFTITYPGQDRFAYDDGGIICSDDTPAAAAAAREIGVRHHLVHADRETVVATLREVAATNDLLPAWEQEMAQHRLAAAAAATHRVVLVGDCADETHFGYHLLLQPECARSPGALLDRIVPDACLNPDNYPDARALLDARLRALAARAGLPFGVSPMQDLLATTHLVVARWLPRLLHNGDIHTMRYSLEARVPFADNALVDAARRIPPSIGFRGGVEKAHLRDCVRGMMPEAARVRRKSALPVDQGLAPIYKAELTSLLSAGAPLLEHFLDVMRLAEICHSQAPVAPATRALLFRAACLGHWQARYNVTL